MKTRLLVLCVIVLLIFAYIWGTFKVVAVEQAAVWTSNLQDITLDMLYRRIPIIIRDKVVKPEQLLHTLFKYQFVKSKTDILQKTEDEFVCKGKFTLVVHDNPKVQTLRLILTHPSRVRSTDIELELNQVLIIPTRWIINNMSGHAATRIRLDDIITLLV